MCILCTGKGKTILTPCGQMIVAQFRQLYLSQVYFNKEEYEMNEMLVEGSYQSYQSVGIYHLNDVFPHKC